MYGRDKAFYDVVASGLASLGYGKANGFQMWVNDMFAEKYNADKTFAEEGFPLNPDIPVNPTYEQIEATIRPYTMAAYVDIDADGPSKSTDGLSLKMGGLPTFKHEVGLNRKTLREKMGLMEQIGRSTPEIEDTVMTLMFNGVDDLLGGNYNTMLYQRHQIVSNFGKLTINAANNPWGLPVEIDFGVPSKNKSTSVWYTKNTGGVVTQASNVGSSIDPIAVMQKIVEDAENDDFAPAGHWEMSKTTYNDLMKMKYFRDMYVSATYPALTAAQNTAYGATIDNATLFNWLQTRVGRIKVVDAVAAVESIDPATHKAKYTNLKSFNEGVLVYVPDGAIGDAQFGKPIFMDTPGSRNALFDGGRTLIRQVFNDENMTQVIKSEVTGLLVPNKVRWMYYLTIKG